MRLLEHGVCIFDSVGLFYERLMQVMEVDENKLGEVHYFGHFHYPTAVGKIFRE